MKKIIKNAEKAVRALKNFPHSKSYSKVPDQLKLVKEYATQPKHTHYYELQRSVAKLENINSDPDRLLRQLKAIHTAWQRKSCQTNTFAGVPQEEVSIPLGTLNANTLWAENGSNGSIEIDEATLVL